MDELNGEIWQGGKQMFGELHLSDEFQPGDIRPQQASPIETDHDLFGPDTPLQMVPDFCGKNYGKSGDGHSSIMICGSAYAGFLAGYSERSGLSAEKYAGFRDNPDHDQGGEDFMACFREQVMKTDTHYYGKLFGKDGLLGISVNELSDSSFCLTDLCKTSIVRIGESNVKGRNDTSGDRLLRDKNGFRLYAKLVNPDWIYRRMIQADLVIALGLVAEQGLAHCFWSEHRTTHISLKSAPDTPVVSDNRMDRMRWGYLHENRRLCDWEDNQCWIMTNPDRDAKRPLLMRPVPHPARNRSPYNLRSILDCLGLPPVYPSSTLVTP